mmetsp:Transcript_14588/g.22515  ORF Transcript_14588/g.22515 Transcript_14588/m.22515 type:complete len:323 (-) Transcript_14588:223-1191(-)|eukprot:CAMPEP_0196819972 /NCGR_PEP_ID=MMETSP1362-20130617/73093_1 /TAXON_ID=163516 /ORGANISM="Leptocylindrus danicus, Strain CCMP1856" /LENGTH=322 /DNA_ID=CAMNT_0042198647 /DNA_START=15 /DNA_END=983 /DNA_ORIENTATION=+
MVKQLLPSPDQKWAHSVCSHAALKQALKNEKITSIETDILIGTHERSALVETAEGVESSLASASLTDNDEKERYNNEVTRVENVAIMCHPPKRTSCLSAEEFFECILTEPKGVHMKLDFKEIEAVKPTLECLVQKWGKLSSSSLNQGCVYLNADVLPGPGSRPGMDPGVFLQTCMDVISVKQELNDVSFYSLGWAVDCRAFGCYTDDNVDAMTDLIRRHELQDSGIVLALNARLLVKDCTPFDKFLTEFPSSQILVWTASGEPPISRGKIDIIKNHFASKGNGDRIGFDCLVAESIISGILYDSLVNIVGVYWNAKKIILQQ